MVSWPAVPLLKPFRALRYDEGAAGPLDDLVAPPYDVITPEARDRLLARSPWNAVRLVRPDDPGEAAAAFADWRSRGVLVREEGLRSGCSRRSSRARRCAADAAGHRRRVRLEAVRRRHRPSSRGNLRGAEGGAAASAACDEGEAVADLPPPPWQTAPVPDGAPSLEAELDGVVSRLWRIDEPRRDRAHPRGLAGPLLIADGHHRYETALRFHEEDGHRRYLPRAGRPRGHRRLGSGDLPDPSS